MLDIREIDGEIAKLESGSPSMNDCAKLAVLYTVKDHMCGYAEPGQASYIHASAPVSDAVISSVQSKAGNYGDSDFLRAVSGKSPAEAWAIMDDLMDTLLVVNQRVYDSVMRRMMQL